MTIHFYNKKKHCIQSLSNWATSTEDAVNWLRERNVNQLNDCSFIECHDSDTGALLHRRYMRWNGFETELTNLASTEPDRSKDTLIRERQTAFRPIIDWARFYRDAAHGRVSRSTPLHQLITTYANKPYGE